MLCRVLNDALHLPVIRSLVPTPAAYRHRDPLDFAEGQFRRARGWLRGLDLGPPDESRTVLDVGCGYGDTAAAAAEERLGRVWAFDIDDDKVAGARRLLERLGIGKVSLSVQSATEMAFADSSFDLILLLEVVEHLEDPGRALAECGRVLREDGRLLVTFPPYLSPWGAHLFTYVRIPWAHLLFREQELLSVWRGRLAGDLRAGATTFSTRRRRAFEEASTIPDLWDLNRMTIARFLQAAERAGLVVDAIEMRLPFGLLGWPSRLDRLREYLVTRVTTVLRKRREVAV
jgi:SAM-dependent methyltransferase